MMLTNENLQAIYQLFEAKLGIKLQPVNEKLRKIELRQENDIIPRLQNIASFKI